MDTAHITLHYPGQEFTVTLTTAQAQEFLAAYQQWQGQPGTARHFVLEDEYAYQSLRLDTLCAFKITWKQRPAETTPAW